MVDPCGGHFTCSDTMLNYMGSYIDRVAKARLSDDGSPTLKTIDVNKGFLAHLPLADIGPQLIEPAQCSTEIGRPWFFTREDAARTQAIAQYNWNAATQLPLVKVVSGCTIAPWSWNSVSQITVKTADNFALSPFLFDTIPAPYLFAGQPLAKSTNLPQVEWVSGPIAPLGNNQFCVELDRNYKDGKVKVTSSLGVVVQGTATIRKSVQPLVVNFTYNTLGTDQTINFSEIGDLPVGSAPLLLNATASSGLPVKYFVEAGPAIIVDNKLILTEIPASAKFPIAVTVAAWQWGTCTAPLYKTAITYKTFNIIPASLSALTATRADENFKVFCAAGTKVLNIVNDGVNQNNASIELTLCDLQGKKLLNKSLILSEINSQIDISALPVGLYIWSLKSGTKTVVGKVQLL